MSWLAKLSLANRGLVALVAVIVTAFGLLTIPNLKQQLFPSLDFPAAFVFASLPGRGAGDRRAPGHRADRGRPAGRRRPGEGHLDLPRGRGHHPARVHLRHRPRRRRGQGAVRAQPDRRPAAGRVDPQVFAGSTDDFPVVVLAASSSERRERAAPTSCAPRVVPEITAIDGVREATVTGARDHEIVITPDPAKVAAAGVDVAALATALRANGVAVPAGTLTADGTSLTVQVGTPLTTVDDLKGIYLSGRGGAPGRARSGGRGTFAARRRRRSLTRTNGKPSLGIAVTATPGRQRGRHLQRDQGQAARARRRPRRRRRADAGLRPGPVRGAVDRGPDHRGPARPA